MLQKNIFYFCSNWRIMWTSSLIISIFHFHQNSVSKINLLINSKCQVNSYKSLINFLKQSKYQNLLSELCMRTRIKIFSLCRKFLMKVCPLSQKNNWKVYESFISCWWYFDYTLEEFQFFPLECAKLKSFDSKMVWLQIWLMK